MNKPQMRLALVLSLLSIILCSQANAVTYTAFKKAKSENGAMWQMIVAYYQGIRAGFDLANAELKDRNERLLYCQPPKLSMNDQMLIEILEESVHRVLGHNNITEDSNIDAALLFGLKYTFPCNGPKTK